MSLAHFERNIGDPQAAAMARALRETYGDVPLPSGQGAASEKTSVGVERFSSEARERLERKGFVIYELTGQSIKSQRDAGRNFWSTWHVEYPFEAQPSRQSEVAVNPMRLLLPYSNNLTLAEQKVMVAEFGEQLEVPGATAILSEAPDYTELAFKHLDVAGGYLFGRRDGYNYTRTRTRTGGSSVAVVGDFNPVHGLLVDSWNHDNGSRHVWAAPLVVPDRK